MHRVLVRPYHCDSYGHVNNARYLELLEEARWNLLSNAELDHYLKIHSLGMVIVDLHIKYKRPALPGEYLNISALVNHVGNSSFGIHQEITLDDASKIAEAEVKLVLISLADGKPYKMNDELKLLIAHEH